MRGSSTYSSRMLLIPVVLSVLLLIFASCGAERPKSGKLHVVATTTIIGNVVKEIGGDRIELTVLLPAGAEPHSLEPAPKDMAAVADADLLFINGLGLERFIDSLLQGAGGRAELVDLSKGIRSRTLSDVVEPAHAREHEHGAVDPHVWMDPNNVILWARNISEALSKAEPESTQYFSGRARAYEDKLRDLDGWIRDMVSEVPEARRKLVTDHLVLGYFAEQYGFQQVGAVVSSFTVLAEPTARERAELEQRILEQGVRAVFVNTTGKNSLAREVASDTGCDLVKLYTGSLSGPDGPAPDYIAFIRYNVNAIVESLK